MTTAPDSPMPELGPEAQNRLDRLAQVPMVTREPSSDPLQAFRNSVREILDNRYLVKLLAQREVTARYKDSALGFLWSAIRPLTQLLIYWLVMGQFLGAARSLENFALFIFSGLTIYGLFSDTISLMTGSIVNNQGMIKKVYLPREVFPLATLGSALFNFATQLGILVIASLAVRTVNFGWGLLYAPAAILLVLIYTVALGLMLAAWNVYLRDVYFVVEVVLMLLMWFSPIVYSWTFVRDVLAPTSHAWLMQIYLASPVTLGVLGFQEAFWAAGSNGTVPDLLWLRMLVCAVVGLGFLFLGQRVFAKLQANFAQEL